MSDNTITNSRIAKNTLFLYIRMLFVLIVSLYTSRVILNILGVEDYGIYNVVAGFVSMFSFLNATLSSSVQRFYNYEGTRSGKEGYRQVYITGLIIHFVIAFIAVVLLETFGLWYINKIMNIPETRLFAANVVFQSAAISLIMLLLQIPFVGVIMAKEHMSFYAVVSLIEVVLRLGFVVGLQYVSYDKLILFGFFTLLINIITFFLYYSYSKIKFSELTFKFEIFPDILKQIIGFSAWNVIGTFAFMLKGQGLNLLLNYFFGPIVNAARGIAYQVNVAVGGFASNISIAFRPEIVNSYASGSVVRSTNLVYLESRVCYMLISVLIAPLFFNLKYVLNLWLGETIPQWTEIFTVLILIDTLVCTLNTPVTQIVMATGKIRLYQIATSVVNLLLLPVCYCFLKLGYDSVSVFVVTIIFSIINQLVCVIVASKVFQINYIDYVKKVIIPCLLFSSVLFIIIFVCYTLLESSLVRLLLTVFIELIIAIPLFFYLGLESEQRTFLKNKILSKFQL